MSYIVLPLSLFEDHRTKNRTCNKMNTTVPHVEQELLTLSEHLSSTCSGTRVASSLLFCVMFCRSLFVLRLSGIALSVFLLFIASDYLFGIFKLSNNLKGQHIKNTSFQVMIYEDPKARFLCGLLLTII
jgi:hypothetical protein